jgi:hypothetical protein
MPGAPLEPLRPTEKAVIPALEPAIAGDRESGEVAWRPPFQQVPQIEANGEHGFHKDDRAG